MSSSRSSTSSRSSSSLSSSPTTRAHSPLPRIGTGTYFSYLGITSSLLGIASGAALFLAFPFPTTIPVFVALLTALTLWTCGTWLGIVWSVVGVRVKAKRWWWWSSPGRRSVEEEGYRVLPQDLEFEEKVIPSEARINVSSERSEYQSSRAERESVRAERESVRAKRESASSERSEYQSSRAKRESISSERSEHQCLAPQASSPKDPLLETAVGRSSVLLLALPRHAAVRPRICLVPEQQQQQHHQQQRRSRTSWIILCLATCIVLFLLCLGITPPPPRPLQPLSPTAAAATATPGVEGMNSTATTTTVVNAAAADRERIFIAANLYNVVDIWETWQTQVLALVEHLGADRTYLSIYESNSVDATPQLLHAFSRTLDSLNIPHRIITDKTTTRHWPHGASEERIAYLAAARNKALEPLASPDASLRLDDYEAWGQGRVLFLNDVIFGWRDAVELLGTRLEGEPDGAQQNKVEGEGDYDLVCAMDFGWSGLYDTWVFRDICSTPAIPFWPYVKDPVSVEKMKKEQVMEVSACWNGIVAFRSDLVAYRSPQETPLLTTQLNSGVEVSDVTKRSIQKRGWQMVDNATDPQSRHSPPVQLPLSFRTSHLDACDHSECFLFSYDLHRLYPTAERKPRILLNPRVRVAYEKRWWVWHNVVLEIPVIKFWLNNWSRGYPLAFVDWIWESARRRDYCTWAGLSTSRPARCPALPGAIDRSWDQG